MFCPQCRYEYRPEVTKCPDCDVWLVKELPVESDEEDQSDEMDDVPLEVVYSTFEYPRILLAASILEEAGVPHYVGDQPIHGVLRSITPGKDPFELIVRQNDLEEALGLLEGIDDAKDLPDGVEPDNIQPSGKGEAGSPE